MNCAAMALNLLSCGLETTALDVHGPGLDADKALFPKMWVPHCLAYATPLLNIRSPTA